MSFRAVCTADVHMSNRLPFARPSENGRTDRLDDQIKLWEHIREVAFERAVDAIFVLGDLFDKSVVDAVTLTHTVQEIAKCKPPVWILPGNHDANTIRGGRFTVEALNELDGVTVFGGLRERLHRGGVTFWPLPFMTADATRHELSAVKDVPHQEGADVLLFHNSIIGCEHLGWVCDDGLDADEVCRHFDCVLAGHFHQTQPFGAGDVGMYLGAPMHHSFGDTGRAAGFWVIDFDDGEVEKEFVPSRTPQFWTYNALDDDIIDARAGDYVRFEIECTHADLEKHRKRLDDLCATLGNERKLRAHWKHKPVYHHEERMRPARGADVLSMGAAIDQYIDLPDVVTGKLDLKKLRRIGRDALASVQG